METRIIVNPKVCHGKPVIRGTRVMVSDILDLLEGGKTFDEITRDYFPTIAQKTSPRPFVLQTSWCRMKR